GIFLNNILLKNLHDNGLENVVASQVPTAMLLPGAGMLFGLLLAIFVSYRKPRVYKETELTVVDETDHVINKKHILVAALGIVAALGVQLYT
ncbi:sodium:proton antiporter, partial [Escherichia coli]|nr:sodium:proton antiporter [Escherichia coli]